MKKNIVLLVPSLKNGGAERVVSRLASLLSENYSVKVVLFDGSNIDYECDAPIISLNEKASSSDTLLHKILRFIRRLYKYKKFKKENSIDLTYSFIDSANIVNILSRGNDKKITSIRGFAAIKSKDNVLNRFIYRPIYKYIHKRADKVVCVSEGIKRHIENEYTLDENKTIVINNGYNLSEIERKARLEIPVELKNIYSKDFIFISVGSYRYEKGFWHLIKAFSEVYKENQSSKLLIIGRGDEQNEIKIRDLIKRLGIEDAVYLPGFQKNIYKYLINSDAYVLSSISEGFPNSMVEAMACGLPVIATDCSTGPREILSQQYNHSSQAVGIECLDSGVIVPKQNAKEDYQTLELDDKEILLSKAMKIYMKDSNMRDKYRIESKKRAQEFSYDKWLSKHMQVFNELLND